MARVRMLPESFRSMCHRARRTAKEEAPMHATTIHRPVLLTAPRSVLRVIVALLIATALLATAFVVGRTSAPTRTIHSVVTAPAAASDVPNHACPRMGGAC